MYPKGYDPDSFVSNPGERYKIEYVGEPDENGFINLVEVGKTDLQELHNRDEFANDVNYLYSRFCNGDISALSQVQGTYFDAFGMPRDLRGMYDMVNNFQTIYDNLSPDKKSKYSFEQFLENAGSDVWIKDFVKSDNNEEKPLDINTISN